MPLWRKVVSFMRILHTEASPGWGGQELRTLTEAMGMRERGHEVSFCVQRGGRLVTLAKEEGFAVDELPFAKAKGFSTFLALVRLMRRQQIDLVNTHSSLDAWIAGCAATLLRIPLVRTRHLSSFIRPGPNSYLLYHTLADAVVTTCADVVPIIQKQAHLSLERCRSIPTGIVPFSVVPEEREKFRKRWGLLPQDFVVGTLCVLRGWKGITDLLYAARFLKTTPHLKWLIVGAGPSEQYFKTMATHLGLEEQVIFTGHQFPPFEALAAFDLFALLSYAHEGVSQASLQAAWLEKPLLTTSTGGLKEVCIDGITGCIVPSGNPWAVSTVVLSLMHDRARCATYGAQAKALVSNHFLAEQMLDRMEEVYTYVKKTE